MPDAAGPRATKQQLLSGWGRATRSRAEVVVVSSKDDAHRTVSGAASVLARGLGRSYGDQATNAGGLVADLTGLDRPVGAVSASGRVTVPGGLSLDALLAQIVPQGWFVPVSPGTRYVTVGGAIAADIHGKNHHRDGAFCQHVESLELVIGDGSTLRCSPKENADVFWATAGGMGLTGVVVEARLMLKPIATSKLAVTTTRFVELDPLLEAMVRADAQAPTSVAWVDLMRSRSTRSVLTTGRFAEVAELPDAQQEDPLAYTPSQRVASPTRVPNGLLRSSTVRAFNEAWFRAAPKHRADELQTIARYYHPLDGVKNWNRLYGPQGFLQWQMVVPDNALGTLRTCIAELSAAPTPCFLAVLKRLGAANPAPLSFPLQGWTLAADMPAQARGLAPLLDRLDALVAEAGGRIYLAKDARLSPDMVPIMYPRLDEWRQVRAVVDPNNVFSSDLDRRLRLTC